MARGAVGVSQLEAALVFRAGLEVKNAARETVGKAIFDMGDSVLDTAVEAWDRVQAAYQDLENDMAS